MFTKNEVGNYFRQILELELQMMRLYMFNYNQINNPEYKRIFKKLTDDKKEHELKIRDIIDMIEQA